MDIQKDPRYQEHTASLNDYVVIYLSDKGKQQVLTQLTAFYDSHGQGLGKRIFDSNTTADGGYKDQLWNIINLHSSLFYNGSEYLLNTKITIIQELSSIHKDEIC